MKILFTGGSSFTGYWFIRQLAADGHAVTAVFRRDADSYAETRGQRVATLADHCRTVFDCSFGDDKFVALAREGFDLFCAHGADVTNYNKPDFDAAAALAANTCNLPAVLDALQGGGCNRIVLTGSVFENDEGAGDAARGAFSPYGLSKAFTWQTFRYQAARAGIALGKFVIPNPFGPLEEKRFTHYLLSTWFSGGTAGVRTPLYVRDNIHVSLLARAYAEFAAGLASAGRCAPSGYVETQGAFTLRVAAEMRARLKLDCAVALGEQTDFAEPLVRINTDRVTAPGWNETAAWDAMADYYAALLRRPA